MSVRVEVMTIPGAPLEGLNPLPVFHTKPLQIRGACADFPEAYKVDLWIRRRVLPYKMQDRYSRKRIPVHQKALVLENEYLKATFWPENGGKLYSLYDKVLGRELLLANPVYQPGNLATRNAWTSGGIEWNFSCYGHNVFTCDTLFAAILTDKNGDEFIRMFEFERTKSTILQMDFHLPAGSPVMFSHIKLFNPFDTDTTTYWWTNIAVPEDGNTRVFSSANDVIVDMGGELTHDTAPYLKAFGGNDLSYPRNATRAFDYFFQAPEDATEAWEASAADDGLVFFDRAIAPLLYNKMFCWGNHSAGAHWQDFLSDPGKGYYIELQSGFARSQSHDKLFPANSVIEWTQCFGGMMLDREPLHQEDYEAAKAYFYSHLEEAMTEEALRRYDEFFKEEATRPLSEEQLVHIGSGWGALEQLRMAKYDDARFPDSVCFPRWTIGADQYPWYALLTEGRMPEEAPDEIPVSWMTSFRWLPVLEESLNNGGEHWYSCLQYGVMLNEQMDEQHVAIETDGWEHYDAFRNKAEQALLRSVELCPSAWAYRCLFCIADERGDREQASRYYDLAFRHPAACADPSFAAEYMAWLNAGGEYAKAWSVYEVLPKVIQKNDRVQLCAARTAIRLRKLEFFSDGFFEYENPAICEGETSLSDIWFEYCALKTAAARGMGEPNAEQLSALIDEMWDTCPPPAVIDFRMSFDRNNKYRMESE